MQGLGVASIRTNLLPSDVTRDRLIEAKKPWAVAAMLGLLVAALINFLGIYVAWSSYSENLFADAFTQVDSVVSKSSLQSSLQQAQSEQLEILETQQRLIRIGDRRFQALELIRTIESMIPRNEPDKTDELLRDEMKAAEAALKEQEASEMPNALSVKPTIPISINYDELHIDSLTASISKISLLGLNQLKKIGEPQSLRQSLQALIQKSPLKLSHLKRTCGRSYLKQIMTTMRIWMAVQMNSRRANQKLLQRWLGHPNRRTSLPQRGLSCTV